MLLVVEDDPMYLRAFLRTLGMRPAICVGSTTEARDVVETSGLAWSGVFVDAGFPEGAHAGLDLLEWLNARDTRAERVIVTASATRIAGAGAELGATVMAKPPDLPVLAGILARCDERAADDAVTKALTRGATEFHLTARELGLLAHTLSCRPSASYGEEMALERSTYKTFREGIKEKTGAASPELLVIHLLARELSRRGRKRRTPTSGRSAPAPGQ